MGERRALLECFKFLSAAEVVRASSTSRLWVQVCRADELWLLLLGDSGAQARRLLEPMPRPFDAYCLFAHVYVIRSNCLYEFSTLSQKFTATQLALQWKVNSTTTLMPVGDGRLFCCGGRKSQVDTFMVYKQSGAVEGLARMPVHRDYPGVCRYGRYVFCFSGNVAPSICICDKFNLTLLKWESLPRCSYARQAFNPAIYSGQIYLVGGCCKFIEEFNPLKETFVLWEVRTGIYYSSSSVIYGGELISFDMFEVHFLNMQTKATRTVRQRRSLATAWSCYPPVLQKGELVLAWPYDGLWKVACFHLATFNVRLIDVPENH